MCLSAHRVTEIDRKTPCVIWTPLAMPKAAVKGRTTRVSKSSSRSKNPKDSHLYTDDNPKTTIHGTGFKDKAAAFRTLDLIKNRSLTYQFQTVNTMYHRAKHHPSMKTKADGSAGTADMKEAMDIFRHWLDVTYPAERDGLRAGGFKPMLGKACVERYLDQVKESNEVSKEARAFAETYVGLPKGKKLGNVLVNDHRPTEADWERLRYDSLDQLVPREKEQQGSWNPNDLWGGERKVSSQHLNMIAWAWSPVAESKIP